MRQLVPIPWTGVVHPVVEVPRHAIRLSRLMIPPAGPWSLLNARGGGRPPEAGKNVLI